MILRTVNGRFNLKMRGRNAGELLAEVLEEFPSEEEITITVKRNSEGFRRTVVAATGETAKALIDGGAFAPGGALSTSAGQPRSAGPQPAQQALPSREWRLPTYCTVCDAPVDEYGFCTNRRCRTPHVAGWHRALPPGGDAR